MARHAVIDLGSNTVRLVIFDVNPKAIKEALEDDARKASRLLPELLDEKKTAGLSAYVSDGEFSQKGTNKASEILSGFLKTSKDLECKTTSIFATAVLRNCTNSQDAKTAIEEKIGAKIDLLSAREEAHLGFVGAAFDKQIDHGTLIDIGGGSTELTVVSKGEDSHNISLPQGSVSSYAKYVSMILPTEKELRKIAKSMQDRLQGLEELSAYGAERAYGIGGSIRALIKLYSGLFLDGKKLQSIRIDQIEELLDALRKDPSALAHQITKSAPDRIHTVIPGTAIALTVMRAIGAKELEACKFGIREGYLIDRVLKLD